MGILWLDPPGHRIGGRAVAQDLGHRGKVKTREAAGGRVADPPEKTACFGSLASTKTPCFFFLRLLCC